jgi:pantothenate kinase type III
MNYDDVIMVSVGNSRTRVAAYRGPGDDAGEGAKAHGLQPSRVLLNEPREQLVSGVADAIAACLGDRVALVLATVNESVSTAMLHALRERLGGAMVRVYRLVAPAPRGGSRGDDAQAASGDQASDGATRLPIPILTELTPPLTVGVDRLLCALAAHRRGGEASVVIDAGTAVTVDFVDAFGVFKGGVIAPGYRMMLAALGAGTDALPTLDATAPLPEGELGRTTADAIRLGCAASVRGLAHLQIDRYGAMNGAYPRVIATGGDAPMIFENDELVEHIVPDLALMGMETAWTLIHFGGEHDDAADRDDEA